ncbi:MAG: energy transducer TonB [Terracidiphilus sp.]
MFEDSTFESAGSIRTRSRRWMLATFTFNGAVLLALALFPLLYPEALPRLVNIDLMTAPPLQQEQQPPPRPQAQRIVRTSDMMGSQLRAPRVIPPDVYMQLTPEPPPATSAATMPMGSPFGGDLFAFTGRAIGPSIRPEPQKARVSQGVMDGLLIQRVMPEYPPIAREMRIEGTVILQANISKAGTIENLRVISGPELLRGAAMAAVRQWRYQPYPLKGEPLEVETTVNVQFTPH